MKTSDIVKGISDDQDVKKGLVLAEQWGKKQKVALVAALLWKAVDEVADMRYNSREEAEKLFKLITISAEDIKRLIVLLPILQSELKKEHFTYGSCDPLGRESVRASRRLLEVARVFSEKNFPSQASIKS